MASGYEWAEPGPFDVEEARISTRETETIGSAKFLESPNRVNNAHFAFRFYPYENIRNGN